MTRSNKLRLGFGPLGTEAKEAIAARQWLWSAVLVGLSAVGSLTLACATPFAALAVVAARTLPPRSVLLTVGGAWLANQALGYGVLAYPWSVESVSWGIAIGAAALICVSAALAALRLTSRQNVVLALAAGLAVAFGAYELCLYAVGFILGGQEAFAPAIVARVALLNVVWAVILMAGYEGSRLAAVAGWPLAFPRTRGAARY